MFPVLDAARVETALHFASGPKRHFAPGEIVYDHGRPGSTVASRVRQCSAGCKLRRFSGS
jgi:hypothetical protein